MCVKTGGRRFGGIGLDTIGGQTVDLKRKTKTTFVKIPLKVLPTK